MGRTQFFTAMSLDGYLADENGSLDWLYRAPHGRDGEDRWTSFFSKVGAMAMGATTYRWAVEHYDLMNQPHVWHEWYGDRPSWVFSHHDLPIVPGADLSLVSGDVTAVHQAMAAVAGDGNIWIVGGGDLVGQFHDAGLLDDLLVSIAPVILGGGAPLLPRRVEGLNAAAVKQNGQRVDIHYIVSGTPSESRQERGILAPGRSRRAQRPARSAISNPSPTRRSE
jgi:dihydrofolate reductase